jgi:glycosyltransferase involved in cell wall biosynthesis
MNKKKIDISIIITTFNRVDNIIKIINSFQKQINITKNFEIIICDSNSKNKLRIINYINQFINLKIKYLNCPVNHQAYKRNFGAKHSSGDYLIFIDDDCFPNNKFLFDYFNLLKIGKAKTIYCGLVEYVQFHDVKNLIQYRNDRLVSFKNIHAKNVLEKNFISMNMALPKKIFLTNKFLFDNRFRFYGFEDFEFAYRFKKKSYQIILSKALIFHKDQRSFEQFLKKYFALAQFGITDIIKINLSAAKKSIFYKIENNFFIIIMLNLPFIDSLLTFLEKFVIFIDKKIFFYFSPIYKLGILVAYLRGVKKRHSTPTQDNYLLMTNNWYK